MPFSFLHLPNRHCKRAQQSRNAGICYTGFMAEIPYTIIYTCRRSLAIHIRPDAAVVVRAPMKTSKNAIDRFIRQKLGWIEKSVMRMSERRAEARRFIGGEGFLYLGKAYPLVLTDDAIPAIRFSEGFALSRLYRNFARQKFILWYRRQARLVLAARAGLYAGIMQEKFSAIRITGARSRWGSCSAKGGLNFTWRLVLAPLEVLDYVVIHELAHLRHRNHSRVFWRRVESFCPDYRQARSWLADKGHILEV